MSARTRPQAEGPVRGGFHPDWDDSPAGAPPRGSSPSDVVSPIKIAVSSLAPAEAACSQGHRKYSTLATGSYASGSPCRSASPQHSLPLKPPCYSPSKADIRKQYDACLRASRSWKIRASPPLSASQSPSAAFRPAASPRLAPASPNTHERPKLSCSGSPRHSGTASPDGSPSQCRRATVPPRLDAVCIWNEDRDRSKSASGRQGHGSSAKYSPSRCSNRNSSRLCISNSPSRNHPHRAAQRLASPHRRSPPRRTAHQGPGHPSPGHPGSSGSAQLSYAERVGRRQFPELFARDLTVEVCSLSGSGSAGSMRRTRSMQSRRTRSLDAHAAEAAAPCGSGTERAATCDSPVLTDQAPAPLAVSRSRSTRQHAQQPGVAPVVRPQELDLCTTLRNSEEHRAPRAILACSLAFVARRMFHAARAPVPAVLEA